MTASRIATEIDFDRDGRQCDFLRLPHSVDRSAYGWIPIPVVCLRNGPGPRVLLMAGNHGDEFEGQVALAKLGHALKPEQVTGRIIILPTANAPAARVGRRNSPVDGLNLNRCFPGDANGSPTEMIAHFIETVLLPQCDAVIDVHSGGQSLRYVPSTHIRRSPDPARFARASALMEAFNAPYSWVFEGARETRALNAAAERCGIVALGRGVQRRRHGDAAGPAYRRARPAPRTRPPRRIAARSGRRAGPARPATAGRRLSILCLCPR